MGVGNFVMRTLPRASHGPDLCSRRCGLQRRFTATCVLRLREALHPYTCRKSAIGRNFRIGPHIFWGLPEKWEVLLLTREAVFALHPRPNMQGPAIFGLFCNNAGFRRGSRHPHAAAAQLNGETREAREGVRDPEWFRGYSADRIGLIFA